MSVSDHAQYQTAASSAPKWNAAIINVLTPTEQKILPNPIFYELCSYTFCNTAS